MAKFAHLVMVTSLNNNKFYDMKEEGDTFTVTYGRIGSSSVTATYPMSDWNKKYREKIRKGYVDMTDMVKTAVPQDDEKDGYKPIDDTVIAEVFRYLQRCSRQVIRENYTVSSDAVTMEMVNAAQEKLNTLAHSSDFRLFNERLLELFTILPRQMTNVRSYLASSNSDFGEIVQREQDLLDVMRGQVVTAAPVRKSSQKMADYTLLEALGIEVEPVTDEEKANIIRHLGRCASYYKNAWRIRNKKTSEAFYKYMDDHADCKKKLLWHGSKNENWLSIIESGLKLNPNAAITGKMFGKGIYFAPSAAKSLGYTSINGSYWAKGSSSRAFMSVMEVACGKPFDIYDNPYGWSGITGQNLDSYCKGANYVFAHKDRGMLKNDELVVYDEAQVNIRYLVELNH